MTRLRGGMRRFLLPLLLMGCVGTVDETGEDPTQSEQALSTGGVLYFYATPAAPGSSGPLALRRANAKPGVLTGPTYGLAIVPPLVRLASDAQVTRDDLDALLAVPFAGNETAVVAIVGARD